MKFNAKAAACVLLANKLYIDYLGSVKELHGVEVEHFAEQWLDNTLYGDYKTMRESVWKHFIARLVERRKDEAND